MEHHPILTTCITALIRLISAHFCIRKIRQAEIRAKEAVNKASVPKNKSQEIFNTLQMIELVKKAGQEVVQFEREVFLQKQKYTHTLLQTHSAEIRRLQCVVKQLEDTIGSMKSQVK